MPTQRMRFSRTTVREVEITSEEHLSYGQLENIGLSVLADNEEDGATGELGPHKYVVYELKGSGWRA